jgi:oligosaccharide repeat unit polymerase
MKWKVLGLIVAALAISSIAFTSSTPTTAWFLIEIGLLVALIPLVKALASRRFDPFEPVYLFAISYVILFVLRPAFDVAFGLPSVLGYQVDGTYTAALLIAIVGAIGFYVGYYLPIGSRLAGRVPLPGTTWATDSLNAFILLCFVISVALFGLFLAHTGGLPTISALLSGQNSARAAALSSSSGYLYNAPLWLTSLGVLLLAIAPRWWSRTGIVGFALVLYSQLAMLTGGARSWILPALAAAIIVFFLRKGARPSLRFAGVALVLLLLFGITIPRQYRNTADRQSTLFETVVAVSGHPGDALQAFLTNADTAMVDDFAIELQFVPSNVDFQYGRTYLEALARPVPRFVWQNKPPAAETMLMGVIWPDFARQNVGFSFSFFGEPYLNFGVSGVFAVALIFGLAWRTLYEWFRRDPRNPTVIAIFALTWPMLFVYMRGGIGIDYPRQAIMVVPVFLAITVAQRRGRKSLRRSQEPVATWAQTP